MCEKEQKQIAESGKEKKKKDSQEQNTPKNMHVWYVFVFPSDRKKKYK